MGKPAKAQSRPRGRPVKNQMPEPIPDTPENIARACMKSPAEKELGLPEKQEALKRQR